MSPRRLLAALVAWIAIGTAHATPQAVNVTGLWINPAESGWGLYLDHQGDTLFATLFVYGADHQPHWYSASALVGNGTWSGALFESTGTAFYEPFNAASVTRRQVGSMTFQAADAGGTVTYDIDGVRVARAVQPFTWSFNDISGSYRGIIHWPAGSARGEMDERASFELRVGYFAKSFSFATTGCTYAGSVAAANARVLMSGNYFCDDGGRGPVEFSIDQAPMGFVAIAPSGMAIAAAKDGPEPIYYANGWMNDLWIAPGESGWGLNLIGQGDILFGTLFVYDGARRAKWYSASSLAYSGATNPDSLGRYSGALYESSGPSFASPSFSPNEVTRRQVGTMSVEFQGSRAANITYTIDGTSVSKQVFAFALRQESLTGTYTGRYYHFATKTDEILSISITDDTNFLMRTTHQDTGRVCTYTSQPRGQFGHRVVAAGSYECTNGKRGTWSLDEAEVSAEGFTALLNMDNTLRAYFVGFRKTF